VGDGGTNKGINENNTLISYNGLLSIHMPAYYDSIIKGVSTVMISYSSWNGVKMHANRKLITGYLKEKLHFRVKICLFSPIIQILNKSKHRKYKWVEMLHVTCFFPTFQGFVISDWQGIDRITSPPHANYSFSVQASVSAGIDMVNSFIIL